MLLYPDVQAKAQEEIDSVVGNNRLPHFDDRAQLPYVDAILRELVRWNPVLPLGKFREMTMFVLATYHLTGIPHATSGDDVYEGYFIPKGGCAKRPDSMWRMWLIHCL